LVGSPAPPFVIPTPTGELMGADVDAWKIIASSGGFSLSFHLTQNSGSMIDMASNLSRRSKCIYIHVSLLLQLRERKADGIFLATIFDFEDYKVLSMKNLKILKMKANTFSRISKY